MKKVILFIAFLLCLALVAAVVLVLDKENDIDNNYGDTQGNSNIIGEAIVIDGENYLPKRNVRNYLIIGVDEFGAADGVGVAQADFITVLSFNGDNNTYTMLSVNRDTMTAVDFYDYFGGEMKTATAQIALSHNDGSYNGVSNHAKCQNTEKAVSQFLYGVEFEGYVSMTMDAVMKIVDYIGGVPMIADAEMAEILAGVSEGDEVILSGEDALAYIRARGGVSDGSNVSRMKRQEKFLECFFSRIDDLDLGFEELTDCYNDASAYMVAEQGIDTFDEIFGKLSTYERGEMLSPAGEAKKGEEYMEFYADPEGLKDILRSVFFEKIK